MASSKATGRRSLPSFTVLREALVPLKDACDLILIASPPVAEHLNTLALIAADQVLIPTRPDKLSTDGIQDLPDTVRAVRERHDPALKILGILPTMYNRGHTNDERYLGALQ